MVGDTQGDDGGINREVAAGIVQAILEDDVDLVLVPGDLVSAGRRCSEEQLRAQLETWRDVFAPLYEKGIGVYPVRGNHEADASGSVEAWEDIFGANSLEYSFTHKDAAFIGLDEYADGQAHQVDQAWLDDRLAGVTEPHLFVFGHDPAFKANHQDCLGQYPAERNTFWNSLEAAEVYAYLCGHDHFYDLARVDDGDGTADNDLYQCIVGTGGGDLFPRYGYNGDNAPYALEAVYHEAQYGYLLVEVDGGDGHGVTMTWKQSAPGPRPS